MGKSLVPDYETLDLAKVHNAPRVSLAEITNAEIFLNSWNKSMKARKPKKTSSFFVSLLSVTFPTCSLK